MKIFSSFCIEHAYTKLVTFYRKSNCTDLFFDFVPTILLDSCLIKQTYKSQFIIDLEITQNPKDNKN